MKIFLFYFEMAIKITGSHKIIGSVGLAETHLFFFRPYFSGILHVTVCHMTFLRGISKEVVSFAWSVENKREKTQL